MGPLRTAAAAAVLHLRRHLPRCCRDRHVVLRLRLFQRGRHARRRPRRPRRATLHRKEVRLATARTRRVPRLRRRTSHPRQRGIPRDGAGSRLLSPLGDARRGLERLQAIAALRDRQAAPHYPHGATGRLLLLVALLGTRTYAPAALEPPPERQATPLPPLLTRSAGSRRVLVPVGRMANGGHRLGLARRSVGAAVGVRRLLARTLLRSAARHLLLVEPEQEQPAVRAQGWRRSTYGLSAVVLRLYRRVSAVWRHLSLRL